MAAAVVMLTAASALAQVAPSLGSAQSYTVLAGSTVTNTGSSVVTGDLGVSPAGGGAPTGFPPGLLVGGSIHTNDASAIAAQASLTAAYLSLGSQPCTQDLTGQDLGGKVLTAGVYCYSSSAQLTGVLTLDARGDPGAVFIFKMGSTLTTASGASVVITNGGSLCNVFWQVGSSATIGTTTSFAGNILALTSITLNTGANLTGRALARNGAVTLDTNAINSLACVAGGVPPSPPAPASCAVTAADLFIVKHHTDSFAVGVQSTYSIALFNLGIASTGTVTVVDTLPTGLTFVSAAGTTWSCAAVGQVVTCTTAAIVAAAGPFPNNITLTVRPTAAAVPALTNTAIVSGGADCNANNNSTADITAVAVAVPTLSEGAFILLAILLAGSGIFALRRRTTA
jgi:uncharacterized repeat protein (TIGR01451 family)